MAIRIFIVEDDPIYARVLQYHLSLNPEYEVFLFHNGRDCISHLFRNPSIICLDYSLPDMTGHEVIKEVKKVNDEVPIIIISGQEDIPTAINLLKEGATDYLVKNDETKTRLWNLLLTTRENIRLREEVKALREEMGMKYSFSNAIVGTSAEMREVFYLMGKAIQNDIAVLLSGEIGTGKELIAKSIHYSSLRSKKAFIHVDLSVIRKNEIEREIFGYEKGAFDGADSRKIGKIEQAERGTIYIDEITGLDPYIQAKILRLINEKEFVRLGGKKAVKADVRLIVSTRKILSEEVARGKFREDLYYRLLGISIQIPALRARGNDVLALAKHFLSEYCSTNAVEQKSIAMDTAEKLLGYDYPGNVSELRAVVELAAVLSSLDIILPEDIRFSSAAKTQFFYLQELTFQEYEKRIIHHFLDKYDNNVLTVARKLNIGKSTIYRFLQKNEK